MVFTATVYLKSSVSFLLRFGLLIFRSFFASYQTFYWNWRWVAGKLELVWEQILCEWSMFDTWPGNSWYLIYRVPMHLPPTNFQSHFSRNSETMNVIVIYILQVQLTIDVKIHTTKIMFGEMISRNLRKSLHDYGRKLTNLTLKSSRRLWRCSR